MIAFEIDLYYSYVMIFFRKDDVTEQNVKKLLDKWYNTEGKDKKAKCKKATDYIVREFNNTVGVDIAGGVMIDYYKIYTIVLEDFSMDDMWSHGILAHEIAHVTNGILRQIRMPLTEDSEEGYTYLTQYITSKAYKYLIENNDLYISRAQF